MEIKINKFEIGDLVEFIYNPPDSCGMDFTLAIWKVIDIREGGRYINLRYYSGRSHLPANLPDTVWMRDMYLKLFKSGTQGKSIPHEENKSTNPKKEETMSNYTDLKLKQFELESKKQIAKTEELLNSERLRSRFINIFSKRKTLKELESKVKEIEDQQEREDVLTLVQILTKSINDLLIITKTIPKLDIPQIPKGSTLYSFIQEDILLNSQSKFTIFFEEQISIYMVGD